MEYILTTAIVKVEVEDHVASFLLETFIGHHSASPLLVNNIVHGNLSDCWMELYSLCCGYTLPVSPLHFASSKGSLYICRELICRFGFGA